MVKKTMQATQKLPTAKADIRPDDAKKPEQASEDKPIRDGVKLNSIASDLPEVDAEVDADSIEDVEIDLPSSPMSLADVNAILADNYPGYTPIDPRGTASGLQFTLPDGKSINVQRKRVKACANMEELRAYVGGLL